MKQYHKLIRGVLEYGERREDRTGTGTISLFCPPPMRFRLENGFPLVTTKRTSFRTIKTELLWFLRGESNIASLHESNCHIWDEWADESGNLGPIYGVQWVNWGGVNQIAEVIKQIKTNPYSRRHIVSAWNVGDLDKMALPPCHMLFQFYVRSDGLSCCLTQRSGDVFLGVPYNIASYAMLTHMIASIVGIPAIELIVNLGDAHIYLNHIEQVNEVLRREPTYRLPKLWVNPSVRNIDDFLPTDLRLDGYNCYPAIKGEIAI